MKSNHPKIAFFKVLAFYLLQVSILTTASRRFLAHDPQPIKSHASLNKDQRSLTGEFKDPTEREFAKALVEKNFHGDWHFTNSTSPSNSTFQFFQNQGGIFKISTTKTPDDEYILDLLLVDGSNTDQKFLILTFHQNIFVQTLNRETSSFQLTDHPVTYRKGDNFFIFTGFADKLDQIAKCSLNSLVFSFWNAEKNRPFEPFKDNAQNLRLMVSIESQDCGISIEGTVVQNYGKKFNYQIWVYLALVCLCLISQLIGLIVHNKTLNSDSELSLPHRFQLSFIITLNIQFVKMNLMFFGEYLYDFSRAWVFLLVALGFFLVFLLEIRILFSYEGESFHSYSWGPFAGIGLFICFLMFSSDYYWILYPYIMTPAMDILQSYTYSRRWNYSFTFYFGYLMPYLPLIGYFKWYQDNFARFSPAPPVVHWCSFFIFFGLTWLIIRTIIKKFSPQPEEPQFQVMEAYEGEGGDVCAICLEQLKNPENKKSCTTTENAKKISEGEESVQQENVGDDCKKVACKKILQTPCGHHFHIKCMEKWLLIKTICPLCSRQTPENVKIQGV